MLLCLALTKGSCRLQEEQGRTAMGKLSRGLKGMLGPRTEQPAAGASTAGESAHSSTAPRQKTLAGFRAKIFSGGSQRSPGASPPGPGGASPGMSGSPGPLPIADDPAGEGRVGEGHGQHRGPGAGTRGGHFADRLAGNIRRAMGMPQEVRTVSPTLGPAVVGCILQGERRASGVTPATCMAQEVPAGSVNKLLLQSWSVILTNEPVPRGVACKTPGALCDAAAAATHSPRPCESCAGRVPPAGNWLTAMGTGGPLRRG